MKKLAMVLVALTMALTASAQFEEGKWYGNASLSGLTANYTGSSKFALDMSAKAGYCIFDNIMVLANAGVKTAGGDNSHTDLSIGVGGRYYIIQNGIYLGVNCQLKQVEDVTNRELRHNDVMPGIEVGYAFFLNGHVTIEPAIYYDQSFKSHKDYSTIGFRIGVGVYL